MNSSRMWGFAIALISVVLATLLRFLVQPLLADTVPYITYFIAVMVTALYGGFWPGLLALALSVLAAGHFIILPADSLLPGNVADWVGLALFVFLGVAIAWISEAMRMARRRAETNALTAYNERERYAVTLASIGDGVIVCDATGRVTFLNTVAEELTGWSIKEAQGEPLGRVFYIINEATRVPAPSLVERVIKTGQIVGLANHTTLIAQDGSERAIDDSASPIRGPDGQIIGVIIVFRDVSQKRTMEIQRGRLAALVGSSEDAIIGQSLDGMVTDWNAAAEQLFGFSAEETVGKSIFATIVPPDRKDELLSVLARVRDGEQNNQFETVRRRKNGQSIPILVRISPIKDAEGNVIGASAIDRDISQQKAAERRRNARLAVTQLLAHEESVEAAAVRILEAVGTALEWDTGCLWQMDPAEHVLQCTAFWSQPSASVTKFQTSTLQAALKLGRGLPGRVWASQQAIWVPDVGIDPDFSRAAEASECGLHGGFGLPIIANTRFLGVIEFFSREIQKPDDDLLEMMATLGGQVGQFIERREAEQDLRRSERELADFFENAAVGLHWVDAQGIIQRVNQAELDLLGYTREEYVGHNLAEFHADADTINDILGRLAAGEALHSYEARLRCKDGSIRHVLIESNVLWEDGRFVHSRCFTRDITDRKLAEEALRQANQEKDALLASLRESEEQFRLMSDSIPQLAWMAQPDGHIDWYNSRWFEYTGTTSADMQGLGWQSVHDPGVLPQVLERWRVSLETGEPFDMVFPLRGADGKFRPFLTRVMPLRLPDRSIRRWFGTNTDISEQVALQEELRQIAAKLSESDRRKDEFLATLAHELRNPLAPICTGLELMKLAKDDPVTVEEARQTMERQAQQLVTLVDDLLDVSRITRGKFQLRRCPVRLEEVVQSAVEAATPLINDAGHELTVTLPEQSVHLEADPHRLAQVLSNLLNNAAKYTPQGGRIFLTAERQGSDVLVSVKDTGIGIPEDMRVRIFEMFTQIDRPMEKAYTGLGIGLTLVKSLVEMHKGAVDVRSDGPNLGSEFTVRLPVLLEMPTPSVDGRATEVTALVPQRRVLVVDDNKAAADMLTMVVKMLGNDVRTVGDGQEAIEVAAAYRPDVVLMDLGMPKMNGYEVARHIRRQPWGERMVLVALTGWGQDEDKRRTKAAGFDHHLVKPAEPSELQRLLAELSTTSA